MPESDDRHLQGKNTALLFIIMHKKYKFMASLTWVEQIRGDAERRRHCNADSKHGKDFWLYNTMGILS